MTELPEQHPGSPPYRPFHYIRSLVVSKDGQRVLSASDDGTIISGICGPAGLYSGIWAMKARSSRGVFSG